MMRALAFYFAPNLYHVNIEQKVGVENVGFRIMFSWLIVGIHVRTKQSTHLSKTMYLGIDH